MLSKKNSSSDKVLAHITKRHLAQILYKKILVRECAKPKTAKSICSLLHKHKIFCQEFGHIFAKKLCLPKNYTQINDTK